MEDVERILGFLKGRKVQEKQMMDFLSDSNILVTSLDMVVVHFGIVDKEEDPQTNNYFYVSNGKVEKWEADAKHQDSFYGFG